MKAKRENKRTAQVLAVAMKMSAVSARAAYKLGDWWPSFVWDKKRESLWSHMSEPRRKMWLVLARWHLRGVAGPARKRGREVKAKRVINIWCKKHRSTAYTADKAVELLLPECVLSEEEGLDRGGGVEIYPARVTIIVQPRRWGEK